MRPSSVFYEIAAFEPRAFAVEGCSEKLSPGVYTIQMSVDLFQLALGKHPPLPIAPLALDELGDLTDREAHLLKERDHRESL
jgi:hypothetical protein